MIIEYAVTIFIVQDLMGILQHIHRCNLAAEDDNLGRTKDLATAGVTSMMKAYFLILLVINMQEYRRGKNNNSD